MGFGFGFWVYGCSREFCNILVLFMLFGLGLKFLRLSFYCKGLVRFLCEFQGKTSDLKDGFSSENDVDEVCDSKILACKDGICTYLKDSSALENLDGNKEFVNRVSDIKVREADEEEGREEDNGEDITALKILIRIERGRANASYLELEKERMAAASAAEEAMAMILRLQNEKSSVEMQAHQYRRLAEQKQLYDQEVIRSLRWIILKYESDRSLLEGQLKLCRQRLKHHFKAEELDRMEGLEQTLNSPYSTMEDGLTDALVSSLDMDSRFHHSSHMERVLLDQVPRDESCCNPDQLDC